MTFTIQGDNFLQDGKKTFLLSGEIHYWRIKKDLWRTHLHAAKEAGLRTVSTYIPWAWHESVEGVFDFDGQQVPEKDLHTWIRLCQEYGLTCILKPGPFILAEFWGAGLPDWFLDRYAEEVKMRNSRGEIVPSDGVSLFHERYLEKVKAWYNRIMPLISSYQSDRGGPVIMMQLCNEIGVFSWLAHQGDYSPVVKEKFIAYLESRFAGIGELNRIWGTAYASFNKVELPPDGKAPYSSAGDRGRDYEWHRFWRAYYADYLKMLTGMVRERGVTLPLYHNLPGWIYGSGYEFPVNITMYDELFGDKSDIIFGADHIPEFLSYRNLHDDRIINDITAAVQGSKPLFAAEFQSGSREYHVVTNPREMELFYKASLINGLTGWNYYMFSQGRNAVRTGYSGDTFYWFTPLSAEGERGSAFPLVKRMNSLITSSEEVIVEARRRAEICVLFYPHYYASELERPVGQECGLRFVPSAIRRPAYFDGLLKALQILNVDYDMLDLTRTSAEELSRYKQVWSFTTDEMNAADQLVLADYARNGGELVVYPCLPDREMNQQACTILRDALHIRPSGFEAVDSPLVDIFGLRDIKCANPQVVYNEHELKDGEVIARTLRGSACGFRIPVGKGLATHLGTWVGFDTERHKDVYRAFLGHSAAQLSHTRSDNDAVAVRERFTPDGHALLFIGNYYNEPQSAGISYTHPESGEQIQVPFKGGSLELPPLYAVFSPVCRPLGSGISLLHTTSDLLSCRVERGTVAFTLYGDRELRGELVLEGEPFATARQITCSLENAVIERSVNRLVISYPHQKEEFILEIVLGEELG
ncbi:MAG: beta-galactosidase [Bacteroidota bacterium]